MNKSTKNNFNYWKEDITPLPGTVNPIPTSAPTYNEYTDQMTSDKSLYPNCCAKCKYFCNGVCRENSNFNKVDSTQWCGKFKSERIEKRELLHD